MADVLVHFVILFSQSTVYLNDTFDGTTIGTRSVRWSATFTERSRARSRACDAQERVMGSGAVEVFDEKII